MIAREEHGGPGAAPVRRPGVGLCEVVESLRGRGYAIHVDVSCSAIRDPVAARAVGFLESAVSVAGHPTSGRGYVRISETPTSLLVELTNLNVTAFDAFPHDQAALRALEVLRDSTDSLGDWLSVERGPRGQLRIATVIRGRAARGGNGDGEG